MGESIAANNAYRQREAELSVKRVAVQEVPLSRMNTSVLDSSSGSSRSVHSLVEKIQNGLEVEYGVLRKKDALILESYIAEIGAYIQYS